MRPAFALAGILLSLAACGIPRMPNDQAGRCAQGLSMVEQQVCGNTRTQRVEAARYALAPFDAQCTDAASVAHLRQIRATCLPKYFEGETARIDERRAVRQRYVAQVSELLLDPDYGPAVDRYQELEDRRFHGERNDRELGAARAALVRLAAKHGVDARYAKELALW